MKTRSKTRRQRRLRRKSKKIVANPKSGAKLPIMVSKIKDSSKLAKIIKAGLLACLLPVFFLYVLLDKPDYKIIDSLSGAVVPAARVIGDGLTWPVRAIGKIGQNIAERSDIRKENKELRKKLDELILMQTTCASLNAENQRLTGLLDIKNSGHFKMLLARVIFDNSMFARENFLLDKGTAVGIKAGTIILSTDGYLAGIVKTATDNQAKVMGLADKDSSIAVRVAGSDVSGFLRGRGNSAPVLEYFSDQEFSPTVGTMLITSKIGGNLPDGIPVGTIKSANEKYAEVSLGAFGANKTEALAIIADSL